MGGGSPLASLTTDAGGTTVFGSTAGTVTTVNAQAYHDNVTVATAGTVFASTGNQAVTFHGTLSGTGTDVTVNTAGSTTFGAAVSVASLTTDAAGTTAINGGAVTTTRRADVPR